MMTRDMTRFSNLEQSNYETISNFLEADSIPTGTITIDYNGTPLDILNIDRQSETTIVVFHASLSSSVKALPVFAGMRMLRGLNVNVVCVSDPTLAREPSLKLGWFAGNSAQPLQRDLSRILAKMVSTHSAQHTIFFGASGGGFAALYYSAFVKESLAVVLNPQTVIRAYSDDFVLSYAKAAFGAGSLEEARLLVDRQVTGDVRHLYRGGSFNTVAYVQNYMDIEHVSRHAKPFLDAAARPERIHMLLGDWGRGHVAPPSEISQSILASAVAARGNWSHALAENGFIQAPASELLQEASASSTTKEQLRN